MMRVRQIGEITPEKFTVMVSWLLENFDFENGKILVNDREDIEVTRAGLKDSLRTIGRIGSPAARLLRTYYFPDEEQGIYFRLRFV